MDYKTSPQEGNSYSHIWDVSSMKQFDGGFLFEKATLPAGETKLPKAVFLKCDLVERKAKLVKTAVLHEAITTGSTSVKIKKGHFLLATDILGIGAKSVVVGAIDTSNTGYDTFVIVANALGALDAGAVLQSYDEAGSNKAATLPNAINPFEVAIDKEPTCSGMFRADGIVKSRLPQATTAAIEAALSQCQFLNI